LTDPLKLLAEAAGRCSSRQEIEGLSDLFDREIVRLIRERRLKLGLTRGVYAARAGSKETHVVNVEHRNARPKITDLYGAAKVLNPADENTALKLAVELQRQAAKGVLQLPEPGQAAARAA
jgi:hypothetical protein